MQIKQSINKRSTKHRVNQNQSTTILNRTPTQHQQKIKKTPANNQQVIKKCGAAR